MTGGTELGVWALRKLGMSKKLGAVVDMKNELMSKDQFPQEVTEFFREQGRKGAEIHRISPQAAAVGVAVRQAKADLIRQGYAPGEALKRARIRVKGESP
jgi:hypothetical protein